MLKITNPATGKIVAWLEHAVTASALPEPKSLFKTLSAWRRELLTFCRTRVTNARTEAANLTVRFVRPWWTWASWLLWPLCAIAAALVARRTRRARQA